MKILVIDVGGTHVKLLATGRRVPIKIDSGLNMTAKKMVADVRAATADWNYEVISMGYPGPVVNGRPFLEPVNLGRGWVGFDFKKAFHRPIKIVNDAAMQALASYEGGRMLFLGLGTGLGSTLIVDGAIEPMELAHLPYKDGRTYEDFLGEAGLKRWGKKKWRHRVKTIVAQLKAALQVDYVMLGGGNVRLVKKLPPDARLGSNENAFSGGYRLWSNQRTGHSSGTASPNSGPVGVAHRKISGEICPPSQPRTRFQVPADRAKSSAASTMAIRARFGRQGRSPVSSIRRRKGS
jgi:predicted NBD/HSP70 family sugar kinase